MLPRLFCLFLPFAAVLAVCLGLRFWDKLSYQNDPVWKNFRDFDVLREELYDYGFPDYAANLEVYKAAGISDTGYTLYRNWNFTDPDRFTPAVMQKLIEAKEKRHFGKETIRGFIREVPLKLVRKPVIWFFLFLLVVFFAGGGKAAGTRKASWGRNLLCILWGLALFGVLYLYLYYNGRYLRDRVDTGLVYALCISVLWLVNRKGVARTWWIAPVMAAVLLAAPGVKRSYPFRFRAAVAKKERRMEKRRGRFEQLMADPDHLYVMKMGAMIAHDCYGPLDIMPEKVLGNVLYLGGWAAYSRAFMDTMDAYGISNPYRDLIGSEKLYLVDDDIGLTMAYIREYYDEGAAFEEIGELGDHKIYRILSGPSA